MNKFFLALVFIGSVAMKLPAQNTNISTPYFIIGAADANNHNGEGMIVTGLVAEVNIRSQIVFLNLEHPYPNSPFTLVIPLTATNQFGDISALFGKHVQATGKIIKYRGQPEIILESSNQLSIVNITNSALIRN